MTKPQSSVSSNFDALDPWDGLPISSAFSDVITIMEVMKKFLHGFGNCEVTSMVEKRYVYLAGQSLFALPALKTFQIHLQLNTCIQLPEP